MTKIRDECEVVDNVTDLGSRLNILSRLNGNRMPVFLNCFHDGISLEAEVKQILSVRSSLQWLISLGSVTCH